MQRTHDVRRVDGPRWPIVLGLMALVGATGCQASGYGQFAQWSPPRRLRAMQQHGRPAEQTPAQPDADRPGPDARTRDSWRPPRRDAPLADETTAARDYGIDGGWRGRGDEEGRARRPPAAGIVSSADIAPEPSDAAADGAPRQLAEGAPRAVAMAAVTDAAAVSHKGGWAAARMPGAAVGSAGADTSPQERPLRVPLPTTD